MLAGRKRWRHDSPPGTSDMRSRKHIEHFQKLVDAPKRFSTVRTRSIPSGESHVHLTLYTVGRHKQESHRWLAGSSDYDLMVKRILIRIFCTYYMYGLQNLFECHGVLEKCRKTQIVELSLVALLTDGIRAARSSVTRRWVFSDSVHV